MSLTEGTTTVKKVDYTIKGITVKQLEGIIKKYTSQSGQSIVFDITRAATEINKNLKKETDKVIKQKTDTLEFKLSCIKQMLENIEFKDAKSLSRTFALSRPKRKKIKKKAS